MKCINKPKKVFIFMLCAQLLFLCACSEKSYLFPYPSTSQISSFNPVISASAPVADGFAGRLCVTGTGNLSEDRLDMSTAVSALLCDLGTSKTLYAKNVHEKRTPASLTKVMTAYVAIKYGKMDQVLVASENVLINERGAQLCKLKPGDSMTLSQALRILLIYSANDVAVLIAEGVGGSLEEFVSMMNREARSLGATNTCFQNPHGLTVEGHYTTAYDLYLIFNAAISMEVFREIIAMSEYKTIYQGQDGKEVEFECKTTNFFLNGTYLLPTQITLVGGKTGYTQAAGFCLVILTRDSTGNLYVSVILGAQDRDALYHKMAEVLSLAVN